MTEDTELITERRKVYGNPEETFARIAQVWSGIIGHEIQPWEVPLMMEGMKLVRTQVCPDYSDNSDDIVGYNDIFKLIIGPDMIQARSVEEYLRIKRERQMGAAPSVPITNAWPEVDTEPCMRLGEHLTSQRHPRYECPTYNSEDR